MKIRCLIIDDEPLAVSLLERHIRKLDFMELAGTGKNAAKALELLNSEKIALLFLDIKMPGLSGIDLLKTLKNPPKTIITSAYREYALEGYELDVVDYLLKPITFERFFSGIERYLRIVGRTAPEWVPFEEHNHIHLKSANKYFILKLSDILYAESMKDYLKVNTKNGEIMIKYTITDFESLLNQKGFLRVHRSYLVNVKNILSYSNTELEIEKAVIPIGETYKEYVFSALIKL
jgi:DNA-binding LytR/AlgR family response regulator